MASPALVPQRAAGMLARLEQNVQRVIVGKAATVRLAAEEFAVDRAAKVPERPVQ